MREQCNERDRSNAMQCNAMFLKLTRDHSRWGEREITWNTKRTRFPFPKKVKIRHELYEKGTISRY